MSRSRIVELHNSRIDEKIVLSALWTSVLLVFAFVDIFGFWREDVINGALGREVPGSGLAIDQVFLALATAYVVVPSLMIVASLLIPAKANRTTNLIVSLSYFASIVVNVLGEGWTYYILGSVVEGLLLLAIAYTVWTWPKRSADSISNTDAPGMHKASDG